MHEDTCTLHYSSVDVWEHSSHQIKQLDTYQYLLGLIFLKKYLGSTSLDKTQGLSGSGEKVGMTEAVAFFHVALCYCWWQQPALLQCSKQWGHLLTKQNSSDVTVLHDLQTQAGHRHLSFKIQLWYSMTLRVLNSKGVSCHVLVGFHAAHDQGWQSLPCPWQVVCPEGWDQPCLWGRKG